MRKKIISILKFPIIYVLLGALLYVLTKGQLDFNNPKTMKLIILYCAMGGFDLLLTIFLIIKTISNEKKIIPFYIEKYWEKGIGGSDDAMMFVDYLANKNKAVISVREIFSDLGFSKLQGNLRHVPEPLEVPLQGGLTGEIYQPIEVITVLAALILEIRISGSVCLKDLDETKESRRIKITLTHQELADIKDMLQDYIINAKKYDIYELMLESEANEVLECCGELLKGLS